MVWGIRAIWGYVFLLATGAALLALGGESAIGATALPTPDLLPRAVVAVVSEVPVRRGRITKAEFRHALLLEAVAAGGRSAPKPGAAGYEKAKVTAIDSLLERAWIVGLAADWGLSVTRAQVAREVAVIKNESFKDGAEFRRFLKESRYTRRDVNERVEIQMISGQLQRRLSSRIDSETTSHAEEQRAFAEFVAGFQKKWRGRTVCAPDYVTSSCSNGPAV